MPVGTATCGGFAGVACPPDLACLSIASSDIGVCVAASDLARMRAAANACHFVCPG